MGRYVNIDKVLQGKFPVTPHRGDLKDMFNIYMFGWNDALDIIATMTVEDVAPVVHARWVDDGYYADFHPHSVYRCSNCDWCQLDVEPPKGNYCPFCGAKMDGEVDDE